MFFTFALLETLICKMYPLVLVNENQIVNNDIRSENGVVQQWVDLHFVGYTKKEVYQEDKHQRDF